MSNREAKQVVWKTGKDKILKMDKKRRNMIWLEENRAVTAPAWAEGVVRHGRDLARAARTVLVRVKDVIPAHTQLEKIN